MKELYNKRLILQLKLENLIEDTEILLDTIEYKLDYVQSLNDKRDDKKIQEIISKEYLEVINLKNHIENNWEIMNRYQDRIANFKI